MAAVAAVFEQVGVGGTIVLPRDGYYGTRAFLDATVPGRWTTRLVDIWDTEATVAACRGAELLWIESPTNPKLDVADIPALCEAAHALGVRVAVGQHLHDAVGAAATRPRRRRGGPQRLEIAGRSWRRRAGRGSGRARVRPVPRSAPAPVDGGRHPGTDGSLPRHPRDPYPAAAFSPSPDQRRADRQPSRRSPDRRAASGIRAFPPIPGINGPAPRWRASAA